MLKSLFSLPNILQLSNSSNTLQLILVYSSFQITRKNCHLTLIDQLCKNHSENVNDSKLKTTKPPVLLNLHGKCITLQICNTHYPTEVGMPGQANSVLEMEIISG